MNFVTHHLRPEVPLNHLLIAFGGWADAGEGATNAVKFLQRSFKAKKLAELDPEEFYDFTQTRPYTSRTKDGTRRVKWPTNEFFYWTKPEASSEAMTFLGIEPNLRWRTFAKTLAEVAEEHGVTSVLHVGALLDAVPHTRAIRLTGAANMTEMQDILDAADIKSSKYQGPTGISSALMEACANKGMGYTSLWGHTSHYLQAAPNYRVSLTLAKTIRDLLGLKVNLSELESAAAMFDEDVANAISSDEQLSAYVAKLESNYDEAVRSTDIPDPSEVVRDLEQFLRSEQRRHPGDPQA